MRRLNLIKMSLKSIIAFLFMASASLVGAQTLQTLCSFANTNGANPRAALTLGNDGNFYGTTVSGGSSGQGTVFKVTTNGVLTMLVSFAGTNGENPEAALTLGNDGNFYGTTEQGGSNNWGTIFQVTTNGVLTTLVSFADTNGANPFAGLTLGSDGNFYGTTFYGGGNGYGTVFQMTTNGVLTTLVSFSNTNGANPSASLIRGNDGNFYSVTFFGGTNDLGIVFEITTNDVFITLTSFNSTNGNGNDFSLPTAALTQGSDGNFYGTTQTGGSGGDGTVFQVTTNGVLTTLVLFNGTNGWSPTTLTLGNDGNFYGTTSGGGNGGYGTIFQVTTNGMLVTLVSFAGGTNGAIPYAGLTLGNDGNFYGTTLSGGGVFPGYGTVFRLSFAPSINVQPSSQANYAGSTVMFTVIVTNQLPVSYQWQKSGTNLVNGGNISGANTNTLTITGISDIDAANYSVVVSNSYGTVTSSNATLTVNDLPFIATQPLSQTIGVGSNVTFTAEAYGAPPLVFQWYYNNSPVGSPTSGTNVSSYTLTNVKTNQSGNYSVRVINGYDSVTSSNAVLTVKVFPPSIGTQPLSQRVTIGSNVSFNVSVGGTTPFNYQWHFNNANILNATNAIYAIQVIGTNDGGNYSVVITNSAGSVTSSNAVLTVIVPPTMALQFLAGYPVLNLNGMLSNNFVVQYSTNLASTNWINLLSLTNLSASPYEFLDPTGVGAPARFYRAVMQ
jgi:uncharacterized repeat protein (TIGR03803 family)